MKFFRPSLQSSIAVPMFASAIGLADFIHSGNTPGIVAAASTIGLGAAIELFQFAQMVRKDRQDDADMDRALSDAYYQEGDRVRPTIVAEERAHHPASSPSKRSHRFG
jgi:hypothetical protein